MSDFFKVMADLPRWMEIGILLILIPTLLLLRASSLLSKKASGSWQDLRSGLVSGEVGFWEWNPQSDIISLGPRSVVIYDIPEDEALIRLDELAGRIHPDDRKRVIASFQASAESGIPHNETFRIVLRNGIVRRIHSQGRVIPVADNREKIMVGICQDLTGVCGSDVSFSENEADYRGTFESLPLGIAHVTLEGRWLRVNEGVCKVLGYSRDQLMNSTVLDVAHPEDLNNDLQSMSDALAGKIDSCSIEKRFVRADGSAVWVNVALSLIRSAKGNPQYFVYVIDDIQGRKEAELALQATHSKVQKLSLVASKTQHSVIISDAQRRIEWVNDAFTELWGYTAEEVIGKSPKDLFQGPKTDPETRRKIGMSLRDNKSVAVELINYGANGREYWIELKIDPVFNDAGVLTNYIATQVDITDRKRAENEALLSKERFDCLMKSDIIGILVCHSNGRIVQANDEFLSIVGYSREDLNAGNLNWKKLTPPEWEERDKSILQQIEESGAARPCEKEYYRKDGTRIPVVVGMVKLDKENDTNMKFVLNATAQKEAREKLQAAKQTAEEASRAKSDFLAAMSHELRTPLNGLIGMTELLSHTRLDERQSRFVTACQSNGQILLNLISEILDLTKIEAGHLELEDQPFDLVQLLRDISKTTQIRAQQKGISLSHFVACPSSLHLMGDVHRLRQVLVNLLGNAVKFTERGYISFWAEPLSLSEKTILVRFGVTDSGIGIARDRLHRLFREFSQADESIGRNYGGTGLGLAISKRIVEAMGGRIGVESLEGVGSEFWFEIPFRFCPQPSSISSGGPDLFRGKKGLIVDENRFCRRFLRETLIGWGMKCQTISNPKDAYDQIVNCRHASPFDVVIVNSEIWNIEEELLTPLKYNLSTRCLPVVMIAADQTERLVEETLCEERVLLTPVSQTDLLKSLANVFGETRASSEPHVSLISEINSCRYPAQAPISVLVAEDNETNQIYVREVLTYYGCKCEIVENGLEVLRRLEQTRFDVVFMDCHMPEMNGFEATGEIRRRELMGKFSGHIPIVALTANAIKGDRERCLEAGMDTYLPKPFRPEDLKMILDKVLSESGNTPSSEPIDAQAAGHPMIKSEIIPEDDGQIQVDELWKICLKNLSFTETMLDAFTKDCTKRMTEIELALLNGNHEELAESAHSLKGVAGSVTAMQIHKLAQAVETSARSGSLEEMSDSVDTLKQELELCLLEIPGILQRLQKLDQPVVAV